MASQKMFKKNMLEDHLFKGVLPFFNFPTASGHVCSFIAISHFISFGYFSF